MPIITVLADARNGHHPTPSVRAIEEAGGRVRVVAPAMSATEALDGTGGLLVPDCHLGAAGNLLAAALEADMPVLATGDGMHALNRRFGGGAPLPAPAHFPDDATEPLRHQIYLSPGSKMAAIIGSAGMFRVNSRHRRGIREPQRAERLMTIAYQLDDGIIEGLESKEHSWVIGVQFQPERGDEVPASFNNLFLGLVERAQEFIENNDTRRTSR
ncbi:MAG: gamma-glutamyl-gamma-aminobutyrate hydrolase family protein [Chloroflexota bacterium]|nr:gamma-glutamyl-gamma-aminobutyrate hydrolase family protein [Chloroflexota bacterium]MDE2960763.1 gamma-glutamyl-gamma-aminobutyrate hydrolase family protein [Chloroflexota bacterium]